MNKVLKNILDKDGYLSESEKLLKSSLRDLLIDLEMHLTRTREMHSESQALHTEHFAEIRRRVEFKRESLKSKVDQLATKILDRVKVHEELCKKKLSETVVFPNIDADTEKRLVSEAFRKQTVNIEHIEGT